MESTFKKYGGRTERSLTDAWDRLFQSVTFRNYQKYRQKQRILCLSINVVVGVRAIFQVHNGQPLVEIKYHIRVVIQVTYSMCIETL